MGMTMTQKILAAHAGLDKVEAGQLISARLDEVLGNDITTPVAINEFNKAGFTSVFDKTRINIVLDHFVPNKDIKAAQQSKQCRDFANKYDILNFYDVGQMGIEHALLPEKGIVTAGDCIIGADSHTCTYGALGAFSTGVGSTDMAAGMATGKCWFKVPAAIRFVLKGQLQPPMSGKDLILHIIGMIGVDGALYKSVEFTGPGVASLSMDDRLCICNMAIEAGAKNGIFPVDEVTIQYLTGRSQRPWTVYEADEDAEYEQTIEIDLSALEPTVAWPHLPENQARRGRQGREDRSGGYRQLHQRPAGGYGGRLEGAEGQTHRPWCAGNHHPRHHGHLQGVHPAGLDHRFHRCGLRGFHPHLRALSGRLHGHSGPGRALHLRGPHGPCGE